MEKYHPTDTTPMTRTITISFPVADLAKSVAFYIALESRDAVDTMIKLAGENGGTVDINSPQDHGFMYGRDFLDPDGHVWGPYWVDASSV